MAKTVKGSLIDDKVIVEDLDFASQYKPKGYGEIKDKALWLSLYESCYLMQKDKFSVFDDKKELTFSALMKEGSRIEERFASKYAAYRDLRERGYVVRTGLKYGVDFRVYPRGESIDEAHTKWILHILSENEKFDVFHFTRSVRLSHSVKTSLMLAVVDAESDVVYYKIDWMRP